jgi:hypothetical protein
MANKDFGNSEQLPKNISKIFKQLCQDVAFLQYEWDFYLELFGNKENTDLISELAPASFKVIFEAIRNDITMAISRLSDPAESWGHKHLSFQTLVNKCTEVEGLNTLLINFQEICEPVRTLRNNRVSHRDLNTAIKPLGYPPLPGISKAQIDEILKSAAYILNSVFHYYDNSKTDLKFHPRLPGGAETLISLLKKGKASGFHTQQRIEGKES